MNTLAMEHTSSRSMFYSNPVLTRLSRVTERVDDGAATYAGIASKTAFFLLITLVGVVAQLMAKALFAGAPVWQTITIYKDFTLALSKPEAIIFGVITTVALIAEFAGIFIRRSIPVSGTIYAAGQGYVISFLVFNVLSGYEYLGLEALLLTVAVVLVMSWLYTSNRIRDNKKYRTVLLTLFVSSIAIALLSFVAVLIPVTRPYAIAMLQNAGLSITLDVIGVVIAALFLISDFSLIQNCVEQSYPKEYEWAAAFGLVFTVTWVYLKILDLLMRMANKGKN